MGDNRAIALHLIQGEQSLAWAITLAFYSALHLVEASFARDGNHFDSHTSRNNHFKHERSLQKIWRHYKPLYDHSLKARYLTDDERSAESLIKKHLGAKGVSEKVLGHHLRQVEKSVATILQKASIFDSDISEAE